MILRGGRTGVFLWDYQGHGKRSRFVIPLHLLTLDCIIFMELCTVGFGLTLWFFGNPPYSAQFYPWNSPDGGHRLEVVVWRRLGCFGKLEPCDL